MFFFGLCHCPCRRQAQAKGTGTSEHAGARFWDAASDGLTAVAGGWGWNSQRSVSDAAPHPFVERSAFHAGSFLELLLLPIRKHYLSAEALEDIWQDFEIDQVSKNEEPRVRFQKVRDEIMGNIRDMASEKAHGFLLSTWIVCCRIEHQRATSSGR